jgi:toxin CcdB
VAAQFDLFQTPEGTLVVVVQSDLLDGLRTRVVVPLLPRSSVARALATLNPEIGYGDTTYLVMPQLSATLTVGELGKRIGTLSPQRDQIVRALDALTSGI